MERMGTVAATIRTFTISDRLSLSSPVTVTLHLFPAKAKIGYWLAAIDHYLCLPPR